MLNTAAVCVHIIHKQVQKLGLVYERATADVLLLVL